MSGVDEQLSNGRDLTPEQWKIVENARVTAEELYRGVRIPHHSCGASLAVTFGLSPRPYQSLRRGGITGERFCGSIRAGELILGELLGDPNPEGAVTEALRSATRWYQAQIPRRFDKGASADYICNNLTRQHGDFMGTQRKSFCTSLTAEVAALTAEAALRFAPELELKVVDVGEL